MASQPTAAMPQAPASNMIRTARAPHPSLEDFDMEAMTGTFDAAAKHLLALPEPTPEEIAEHNRAAAKASCREHNRQLYKYA